MIATQLKRIGDLTPSDFMTYPVWTWAEDDDEALVMPLDCSETLPSDHNALFVLGKLSLYDGTESAGVLSVRMSDCSIYLVSFPKKDAFFDLPLHSQLESVAAREQLAAWLDKSVEQIFPLSYSTPYVFDDGRRFSGQIA